MNPDELQTLANALQQDVDNSRRLGEIGGDVPDIEAWYTMHNKVINYLRAQAAAKPAAWRYRWKGSPELHYTLSDPAERDTQEIVDVQPLYSAPAAPQEK